MANFTLRTFVKLLSDEFLMTEKESRRMYAALGESLEEALTSGGTVKLFGLGTLKVVDGRKRMEGTGIIQAGRRVRYKPSAKARAATGNPGAARADVAEDDSE